MGLTAALDATPTGSRPRLDTGRRTLVGSRCTACGAHAWPARAVCHRCGAAPLDPVDLPTEGSLLTFTTVWVPRPGLESPYALGQVDLGGLLSVFAHVHGLPPKTRVPVPVRLELAADATSVPPFWFVPVSSARED